MGWTETRAMHRKANGKPDVKAELDAIYEWSDQIHTSKVLKSQIVRGEFCKSVYYAAVERKEQPYHAAMRTDGTDGRKVYCTVVLIEDATAPGFDFMYKDMDEFATPAEQHCPASILDLLTKTDHEWANLSRRPRLCASEMAQSKQRHDQEPTNSSIAASKEGKSPPFSLLIRDYFFISQPNNPTGL